MEKEQETVKNMEIQAENLDTELTQANVPEFETAQLGEQSQDLGKNKKPNANHEGVNMSNSANPKPINVPSPRKALTIKNPNIQTSKPQVTSKAKTRAQLVPLTSTHTPSQKAPLQTQLNKPSTQAIAKPPSVSNKKQQDEQPSQSNDQNPTPRMVDLRRASNGSSLHGNNAPPDPQNGGANSHMGGTPSRTSGTAANDDNATRSETTHSQDI
ncbi:Glyceraldehyde-3-phosphate dehydrogenase [Bienertia sinuspersici]